MTLEENLLLYLSKNEIYFSSTNNSNWFISEVLVFREWVRYRYGVFPEHGFEGDRMYPDTYDLGGQVGLDASKMVGQSHKTGSTIITCKTLGKTIDWLQRHLVQTRPGPVRRHERHRDQRQ